MKPSSTGTLAIALLAAACAHAQNAAPTASPQTRQTAPASTGAAAQGAQQAESNAAHLNAAGGSAPGGTTNGGTTSGGATTGGAKAGSSSSARRPGISAGGGGGRTGITGVRSYNAGYRARRGVPAPKANAQVTITGDTSNIGGSDGLKTLLPGVPALHNALGVPAGTPIQVKLLQPVDSGSAKNGDMLRGVLCAPLGQVPAGAPVELTVVAAAAAGRISSGGELSLQVIRVNGASVLSEVVTAEGKEGAKILPDDAPARGSEAVFTPDQPITLPVAS